MPRRTPILPTFWLAALLWSGMGQGAAADPPAGLFEATEGAFAACEIHGGEARILEGYETDADLNGDGLPDYVTDLGGISCGAAVGALCDASGCARTVWISLPDGGYRRIELGRAFRHEILPPPDGTGLPTLRVVHGAADCAAAGLSSPLCTRTWSFAGDAPEAPPMVALPSPGLASGPLPRPPAEALPRRMAEPGWTLRRSADGSLVALGIASGDLQSLGAFCLQGMPFLVLRFSEPRETSALDLRFAFGSGALETTALFEETAGDAFVIDLRETRLATRLAGADRSVAISVDGGDPLSVSLKGSSDSLRAALADCYAF